MFQLNQLTIFKLYLNKKTNNYIFINLWLHTTPLSQILVEFFSYKNSHIS